MGFSGAAVLAGLVCICCASPAFEVPVNQYFPGQLHARTIQTGMSAITDVHGGHQLHSGVSSLSDEVRGIAQFASGLKHDLRASVSGVSSDVDEARAELEDARRDLHLSAQEAQAAIGGLAIFASETSTSSCTSYTLKHSRVTIDTNVGVSHKKSPSITVKDAAAKGLICVPKGSLGIGAAGGGRVSVGGVTVTGSKTTTGGTGSTVRGAASSHEAEDDEEIAVGGAGSEEERVSSEEAASGEYSEKLVRDEVHKSVEPSQVIGQGQGIVVTVNAVSSASAVAGTGTATASAGHRVTVSAGHGASASAGHGASASVGHGAAVGHGASASVGHGAVVGHGASASVGHGASVGRGASASVGHGAAVDHEASALVGHGVSVGHGASASTDHGASASVGHGASSSTGRGVFASVGHGASASAGHGASASAGHGVATSVGHGASASAGHGVTTSVGHGASASAGHGASASAGHGVTTSVGHGSSVSLGHKVTASAGHGASASTGHGRTVSVGHGLSGSSGHEHSSSHGEEHAVHREDSASAGETDSTVLGGPEASAIETISGGGYSGAHDAHVVSTDSSHSQSELAHSSSGHGTAVISGSGHRTSSTAGGHITGGLGHGATVTSSSGQSSLSTSRGHADGSLGHGATVTSGLGHSTSVTAGGPAASSLGHGASVTSGLGHSTSATAGGPAASSLGHGATVISGSGHRTSSTAGGYVSGLGHGAAVTSSSGQSSLSTGHATGSQSHKAAVTSSSGRRTSHTAGGQVATSLDHGATVTSSSGTSASSSGGQGFSATIEGGQVYVSGQPVGEGHAYRVTTGTHHGDGAAAAAGGGYAYTTGSGSSSASSVDRHGHVSVDVSGPAAEAAALGADGHGVHLSTTGGLQHIDETNCECVPDYLCDEDGYINTSGAGVIDVRIFSSRPVTARASRCGEGRTCCRHRDGREPVSWLPDHCGTRSPVRLDRRVVSGEAARLGEYPWTVALMRRVPAAGYSPERLEYLCGGSLVKDNVVLTGAHCVKKYGAERLVARVGEWDTGSDDPVYPHQDLPVAEVVYHERFDERTLWYDVALLRLEQPAELSAHVNTICLPTEGDHHIDYSDCYATGWGQQSFDKAVYSSLLKAVPLAKVDSGQCQQRMRETRLGKWFQLHDTFLCAGGLPGVDTCKGDGGGALVCRDTSYKDEETFVQIGIVAWGINCFRGGFPGVYADVTKLMPWIQEKMPHGSYETPGALY